MFYFFIIIIFLYFFFLVSGRYILPWLIKKHFYREVQNHNNYHKKHTNYGDITIDSSNSDRDTEASAQYDVIGEYVDFEEEKKD